MKYLPVVLVLFVISSCSKPEESFIKIPSEFYISIEEQIVPNGKRQVWLELSSTISQYCQEDSLVYNYDPRGLKVRIELLDTYKSEHCGVRIHPLKSRFLLPDFSSHLDLDISLGSSFLIDCIVLNNKADYSIQLIENKGLILKHEKTHKIPENLIWGYAYQKSFGTSNEVIMNNFKRDIEYDCKTDRLPKGYYSYFSILDNNILVLNENPGIAGKYLKFYYPHTKSNEELTALFNKLASTYVDLIGYQINSGSGLEFKSN